MVGTIPASTVVNIVPNVIDAGGTGLDLVGLILTNSTRVPMGSAVRLSSLLAVQQYFGSLSTEASLAAIYFGGYDGSTAKPAALVFWQYPTAAVPAYLRGGLPLTLAQLQAASAGTISLTIDGRSVTSSSLSFGSATSMSDIAATIQSGLNDKDASTTGSITGTAMTVASGTGIVVGQTVSGSGVTVGTKVVSGSGTSWIVTPSQTAASTTLTFGQTTVAYDSISGAFVITAGTPGATGTITVATGAMSANLALTTATGAVTSQGSAIATPAASMTAVLAQTQNFASFMTTFEPVTADALAFAAWTAGQNDDYVYVAWDTDAVPAGTTDTASLMYLISQANYDGTIGIYAPINQAKAAAFVMGWAASLNYQQADGRATLKFRSGSGLVADVTDAVTAANLTAHGYNFYGTYATANDQFTFMSPGSISGQYLWADSFVNQIQLNNALQLALMDFLTSVGRIPFNEVGYGKVEAAMTGPIQDALNFGSIVPGVTLSAAQIAQVNAAAGGRDIATTVSQRGWYILVVDASPQIRAARGPLQVFLYYCDGQAVQTITVSSTEIE
jgi:hypothetical protein